MLSPLIAFTGFLTMGDSSRAMGAAKTVLVALADDRLRQLLCTQLGQHGFLTISAASVAEAGQLLRELRPDALLTDLDGQRATLEALLKQTGESGVPSIVLTSDVFANCGHERELCGADLCIPKPVHPSSLMQSVIALLEGDSDGPSSTTTEGRVRRGLLTLDLKGAALSVNIAGREEILNLAPRDFRLLSCLMSKPDLNHERAMLLQTVWPGETVDERTVDASIMRLRKRLKTVRLDKAIVTVPGKGYRLSTLFASTTARAIARKQSRV